MARLHVAFLWHQHQPYYLDPATGRFALPWVRLHAVKDYVGMVNLLSEFPEIRQTVNLVPSLLQQIGQYAEGAEDDAMLLARVPAGSLSEEQAVELLDRFFVANWENMIHPYRRYRQLLEKRDFTRRTAKEAVRQFSVRDLRDLQVWGNLIWFHPTVIEKDATLRGLVKKGRSFSEEDKGFVMLRQLQIMADVAPLHRRLAEEGRLELTTSPFYHPILPLLCDPASARVARPGLDLPAPMTAAPEDAAGQVRRAVEAHERAFGTRPRGMWPSEGAVSDAAAAIFAEAGIDWIATDEDILARSLDTSFSRDRAGVVGRPETLYTPYRLRRGERDLHVVFRDHVLSDLIGFGYHLQEPRAAADDMVGRLNRIAERAPDGSLVLIALDGENCWENYPNQGVDFLRELYRRLARADNIETVKISDHIDRFGPGRELEHIFPGSWIGHSFATWLGHWEKNRAWEHLARAREFRAAKTAQADTPPDRAAAALEEIYIAEGSDWFWWLGDDHSSEEDAVFDALFRKHIRRVYELLGGDTPNELLVPIMREVIHESWREPRGLINVRVDGRRTSFYEWLGAGSYEQARDVGAMQRAEPFPVAAMRFGLSADFLFLRLDHAEPGWARVPALGVELWLAGGAKPVVGVRFAEDGKCIAGADGTKVRAARDRVVEIAASFDILGLAPGGTAEFFVRVLQGGRAVQRLPANGLISLAVPQDVENAYPGVEGLV